MVTCMSAEEHSRKAVDKLAEQISELVEEMETCSNEERRKVLGDQIQQLVTELANHPGRRSTDLH